MSRTLVLIIIIDHHHHHQCLASLTAVVLPGIMNFLTPDSRQIPNIERTRRINGR